MAIIKHFSQGNNEQEYEGLHSHWRYEENSGVQKLLEANQNAAELHRLASNKAYYNHAIDKAIETVSVFLLQMPGISEPLIEKLRLLKK